MYDNKYNKKAGSMDRARERALEEITVSQERGAFVNNPDVILAELAGRRCRIFAMHGFSSLLLQNFAFPRFLFDSYACYGLEYPRLSCPRTFVHFENFEALFVVDR